MYSKGTELQFFTEKMRFFLNKVYDLFKSTSLEKKIISFHGGMQELFELVESSMHESYSSSIESIGSKLFSDPFFKNTKWWELAGRYFMKYPFSRSYFLGNRFKESKVRKSKFFKFCCLSVVYSFAENEKKYSKDFNRIAREAKSLVNALNLKYYTKKAFTEISRKLFVGVIFLGAVLTYLYGFSTLAVLRVYEPTFFHSLMGSSSALIFAFSLLYFFCVMQKKNTLWKMFFEPSIESNKRASLKLGGILIGCGTFFAVAPFALSIAGADINKLVVAGDYTTAVKTADAKYFDNPDKHSYLLSQIYFNAYNDTKIADYELKGKQEASKYLNSGKTMENSVWAVSNVVREMNDRLIGSKKTKYWYTTTNHEARKLAVLFIFLVGLFLTITFILQNLKEIKMIRD